MSSLADLLRSQNFGPNDSLIASSINHPLRAGKKLSDWIARQTQTAAGIPEQYDNPNPLLAPSPNAQSQAAFDLAGLVQGGAMPFAPKSAGGTLGTLIKNGVPETEYSKAHEIAQRNAVEMLGLAPDNTAMDRAKAMGFDTPAYHTSRTGVDVNELDSGKYAIAPFDAVGTHFGTKYAAKERFDRTIGTTGEYKGSSYPVLLNGRSPLYNDNGEVFNEWPLSEMMSKKTDYGNLLESNKKLRNELFSESTIIPYLNDVEAEGSISYIAPPKNIRSIFAAFDPAKKDSADLLASKLLPATMLGYGMANQRSLSDYFGAQ